MLKLAIILLISRLALGSLLLFVGRVCKLLLILRLILLFILPLLISWHLLNVCLYRLLHSLLRLILLLGRLWHSLLILNSIILLLALHWQELIDGDQTKIQMLR